MKKYELLQDDTITHHGRTLHRIRAVRDFGDVKAGNLGGYLESEGNLSHDGGCWVYGEAAVYGSARVYGEAAVYDSAQVYGSAWVYGSARVYGSAQVYGEAAVYGSAQVYGSAWVYDSAQVYGSAWVCDSALVESMNDWCCFDSFGSENRSTTAFVSKEGVSVSCGCFLGTVDAFRKKILSTHGADSYHGKLYLMMANMIECRLGGERNA